MPQFGPLPWFVVLGCTLTAIVVAFLLRPLWRGKPALPLTLAIVLALATVALYRIVGTPAALDQVAWTPAEVPSDETLPDAIAQMEAELQRDPDQPEGWRLLGRAYVATGQVAKARDAHARAASLAPEQPDVLVEAAETRALADPQRRFDAQAVAQLDRALLLQPEHQRGRWFLGIAQRQAGDAAQAARTWETLLPMVDPGTAASLRTQIDAARTQAGLAPLPAAPGTSPPDHAITVRVTLDPEFAARVRLRGDASVFVIARVPDGPPMPVAVEKRNVAELPFTVTLDDADGPMPTQKLSALPEVELIARLSMSGKAMPQAGDLESVPVLVHLPVTAPVELMIGNTP